MIPEPVRLEPLRLGPTAGTRAVILPGAGSDEVYVRGAFHRALDDAGVSLGAPGWDASAVVASGRGALDAAAAVPGPLLVGGISLGAAVATGWALAHPERVSGVLVALPAWLGSGRCAPAALAARTTATRMRHLGLAAVLAEVGASTPEWLARELTRAWTRQWPHLPDALDAGAEHTAPTDDELVTLGVPVGIVALTDDPLHPRATAEAMHARLPRSALELSDLDAVGADPAGLGAAAVRAWQRARR